MKRLTTFVAIVTAVLISIASLAHPVHAQTVSGPNGMTMTLVPTPTYSLSNQVNPALKGETGPRGLRGYTGARGAQGLPGQDGVLKEHQIALLYLALVLGAFAFVGLFVLMLIMIARGNAAPSVVRVPEPYIVEKPVIIRVRDESHTFLLSHSDRENVTTAKSPNGTKTSVVEEPATTRS